MQFIRIDSLMEGVQPLHDRLARALNQGQHVLWLICGGSNIPVSVEVMKQLPERLTANLTIMLTDERYGPVGHKDSNTLQLDQAGFEAKQSRFVPVLQVDLPLAETVRQYAANFESNAKKADMIIGQFGMGKDGHIAGILPGSPAVTSADLTAGYETPEFVRVTLTPKALQSVVAAYVLAVGADKRPALETLHEQVLGVDQQPAQLIKQLPEAYVYNDQIGEDS